MAIVGIIVLTMIIGTAANLAEGDRDRLGAVLFIIFAIFLSFNIIL